MAHRLKGRNFGRRTHLRLLCHLRFIVHTLLISVLLCCFPCECLLLTCDLPLALYLFDSLLDVSPLLRQSSLPLDGLLAASPPVVLVPRRLLILLESLPQPPLFLVLRVTHRLALTLYLQIAKRPQTLDLLLFQQVLFVLELFLHALLLLLLLLQVLLKHLPTRQLFLIAHHLNTILPIFLLHVLKVTRLIFSGTENDRRVQMRGS
jgi:hypothetical protein